MSGHVFFGERWYGFDDATYTAARLLEILSRARDPSAILNALPEGFSTPELNVPCAEGEPARVVERLRAEAKFPGAREIVTIDGVRVEYKDGFGLIRASNTTPVLVLRFEGATPARWPGSSRIAWRRCGRQARRPGRGRGALTSRHGDAAAVRILIVKLSSLGDVVHALPVVADIHAAAPEGDDRLGGRARLCLAARPGPRHRRSDRAALRRWSKSGWLARRRAARCSPSPGACGASATTRCSTCRASPSRPW
jgi:hypothetical protein